jgi:drug/metabolite transporter (DMT)-like permease
MAKLIAVLNVVAWSGFWAFGYLALTARQDEPAQMVIAALLAFVGAGLGILAYFWLIRHSEATGYARPSNRVPPEHRRQESGE